MSRRQSEQEPDRAGPSRIRFADDSDLTFINYDPENNERFTYRRSARIHNARRRASRNTSTNASVATQPSTENLQLSLPSLPLINPISTFGRDPFRPPITQSQSPHSVEQAWHTIFLQYFGLPHITDPSAPIPIPSTYFLTTAKESDDLYRSIVLQPVATANVEAGFSSGDSLFHNQASILRDFRNLVATYGTASESLSSTQFQHVFASAFSFSGRGFDKEAGYNAIVLMNSMFMYNRQHVEVVQTPISEWFRMLMPRPGPAFDRSKEFQTEMLRKVQRTLNWLERTQDGLTTLYPEWVRRYLCEKDALHRILTMRVPSTISTEPYPGFYTICRHRVLSMFLRHLDQMAQGESLEPERLLQRFENLAEMCLRYPAPQSISLFLWGQLTTAEITGLNQDQDEPLFSWAMKDLLFVHGYDFADHMADWIAWKGLSRGMHRPERLDIAAWRERMEIYYETESTT